MQTVQVEQDVSALIDEWQQTTGKNFSVYGQTFDEFVKKRHNDYVADKENEKILRVSIYFYNIYISCCTMCNVLHS